MISYINSRSNKRVVYASSLKNKNNIKDNQEFLLEGKKSIELALKAKLVKEIFTLKEIKASYDIPQYIVSEEIIEKISSQKNPEGIIAICKTLENKTDKELHKVVYLDGVNDPGNMGTIIRTALAFNYDAVIVNKECVSIYNSKVVSATKGAMFLIPILEGELKDYKKDKVVITSTLNEKSINLDELNNNKDFILVLGNEAHGVSQKTINESDIFVKIPIDNIDSLNVATAGAILMYHLK
ncbi:MAG: RNA methyltransferase [Bacilli bacterium]|nr:RNA methyltransferase [Bacilli bacterium]